LIKKEGGKASTEIEEREEVPQLQLGINVVSLCFVVVPGTPTGLTIRSPSPEDLVIDWIDSGATREQVSNYTISCAITGSGNVPVVAM
jgi:hypothetical protein